MQKSVAILSSTEICSLLSRELKFDMSLGFYPVSVNKQFGERTIRQLRASRCILRGDVTVSDESCTEQYERVMRAHGHQCIRGNTK